MPGAATAPAAAATAAEARSLGDALQSDPLQHANNVAVLLACLQQPSTQQEPVARAAIQALKLFFIEQLDVGGLSGSSSSSKRRKVAADADAAAAADVEAEAQQQYAAWLGRQYAAFTAALLALLGGGNQRATAASTTASASLQVAAVSALMECVRHEAGPATFSNRLFGRLLTTLLLSPGTAPEVLALLGGRHLGCWDVRYHTLRTLARLAQQRAVRGSSSSDDAAAAAAGGDDGGSDDEDEDADSDDDAADEQQQALPKAAADVARAMFDVLTLVQPIMPRPKRQQQQGKKQQQQGAGGRNDEDDDEEEEEVPSWCGASEAGLVTAASASGSLSAKARRKRKQQQQAAAAAAGGGSQTQPEAAAWANRRLQQRAYQEAWLALLRTELPADIYKKVLLKLHADVLPALSSPLLLADFLSHALDRGGFEGMLALNGIFTLVTRHGLEYPAFYTRLYGLLTPGAFTSKHRAQFFQLADIFLSSGMVPAYTAAAFAKRMARLALTAPPAGAMLSVAFVHNIIRRHPACMVMLHKPPPQQQQAADANSAAAPQASAGQQQQQQQQGVDVYDAAEPDPAKSRAVESSLWEVSALRNHYAPQVAAMCAVLDKDLSDRVRTSEVDVGPLLGASYASLLAQELGRKLRRGVPVAFYGAPPAGLFDAAMLADDLPGWDLSTSSA